MRERPSSGGQDAITDQRDLGDLCAHLVCDDSGIAAHDVPKRQKAGPSNNEPATNFCTFWSRPCGRTGRVTRSVGHVCTMVRVRGRFELALQPVPPHLAVKQRIT